MNSIECAWRTARACEGGACIEIGQDETAVAVRDTTDRNGPVLAFPAGPWREFAGRLKRETAAIVTDRS